MKKYKIHLIYILVFLFATSAFAQQEDSIRISLLTCGAGDEIYSHYGHTAIRCENFTKRTDVVYNYGVFDFDTPNFIWRFTLGETDYLLGKNSFSNFATAYYYYGRKVIQQELNLTSSEKQKLIALLEENYLPKNRSYRYNFFYDNCATRPRDLIEKALDNKVLYKEDMNATDTGMTFRKLLHQYNGQHPWASFGIDLCIGSEADTPISRREMMFIPFCVETFFTQANIIDHNKELRPLVISQSSIITPPEIQQSNCIFTPIRVSLLLLIIVSALTIVEIRKNKRWWYIDLFLFCFAGLAGCLLTCLSLFSQHPAVSQNYLIIALHPLYLLFLPWIILKIKRRERSLLLLINTIILILFTLLWSVFPQDFPFAVLPLTLCLLIRGLNNLIITYKQPK